MDHLEPTPDDHDGGLRLDLPRFIGRRRALQFLGVSGVAVLVGCGSNGDGGTASATTSSSTTSTTNGSTTTAAAAACSEIPEETAGPYPGDGSNGPNVLTESGVVRSDITSSFGSSTTVAEGVPLTIVLDLVDTANGCQPLAGGAVYVWHCDREGRYSMYGQGVEGENYLRGVQESDGDGVVTFTSIFPAAYSGRWPHIHFEVHPSLAAATSAGDPVATSQLALPEDICNEVYATSGYEQSVRNLAQTSLTRDMVFGDDGAAHQLATIEGTAATAVAARLTVPV
ncbi:MAG TPA: intradiol ring-cleavage dioxygenase [Acidimicrobiales bacterium]|jgi:protocatechuate 3,4-dioxygenase beta subunit